MTSLLVGVGAERTTPGGEMVPTLAVGCRLQGGGGVRICGTLCMVYNCVITCRFQSLYLLMCVCEHCGDELAELVIYCL